MANHGFGHLRERLDSVDLESILREINRTKFNDIFDISRCGKNDDVLIWNVTNKKLFVNFQIWLGKKGRRIEWPHTHGGEFAWWVQETFASIAIARYKGTITDEGCDGRWKPDFQIQYPTFKDWIVRTHLKGAKGVVMRLLLKASFRAYVRAIRKVDKEKKLTDEVLGV